MEDKVFKTIIVPAYMAVVLWEAVLMLQVWCTFYRGQDIKKEQMLQQGL